MTRAQKEVAQIFQDLTSKHDGIPPTLRQVADVRGCSIATIHYSVQLLIRDGWMRRVHGGHRSVILTDAGHKRLECGE